MSGSFGAYCQKIDGARGKLAAQAAGGAGPPKPGAFISGNGLGASRLAMPSHNGEESFSGSKARISQQGIRKLLALWALAAEIA